MRVLARCLEITLLLGTASHVVSADPFPQPTALVPRAGTTTTSGATPTTTTSDTIPNVVGPNPEYSGTANLPASLSVILFPTGIPTIPFPKIFNLSLGLSGLNQGAANGQSSLGTLDAPQLPAWIGGPAGSGGSGAPWGNANPTGPAPNTGVTRTYVFNVARTTLAPDGVAREMLVVNGEFPGPTIEANWGDTIQVTVFNNIQGPQEGTSLHWHGLRQIHTEYYDGVPGISQCPISPGGFFTYSFQADSFGTSWWHAHYSAQYSGGVVGPMIIHGPNNAKYDADLGPVMLSDWYHRDYNTIVAEIMGTDLSKVRAVAENNLINGKMNFNCSLITNGQKCTPNAGLSKFRFTAGKTYRLRLINSGSENLQRFSIDDHILTVVAYDFVPIKPYNTTVVTLGVGQRADVLVTANGTANGAYFMRSTIAVPCGLSSQPNARAIVYYQNANTTAEPTTTAWPFPNNACANDPISQMVPYYPMTPPQPSTVRNIELNFVINSTGHFLWTMDGNSFRANFNKPLLPSVIAGNLTYPPQYSIYNFGSNTSYVIVVNNKAPGAHPMHLHGHNFYVLNEGVGTWDGSTVNPSNPARRDTIVLRQGGYIAIQVDADNPGVWPFHCHIAWHVSAGLYANIIERPKDIPKSVIYPFSASNLCVLWDLWSKTHQPVNQIDSGLRMLEKNKVKRGIEMRRDVQIWQNEVAFD